MIKLQATKKKLITLPNFEQNITLRKPPPILLEPQHNELIKTNAINSVVFYMPHPFV